MLMMNSISSYLLKQFICERTDALDSLIVHLHVAVHVIQFPQQRRAVLVVSAQFVGLHHHLLVSNPGFYLVQVLVELQDVLGFF